MTLPPDDMFAIHGLVANYNFAIDSGDGDAFAATFTHDGVLEAGGSSIHGREALRAYAPTVPLAMPKPRHVVTSLSVDGNADSARLRAYIHMFSGAGRDRRVVVAGTYHDELTKVGGQWLFVKRHFEAD
jgi:uncharacterized protein (TIGR02246 family)